MVHVPFAYDFRNVFMNPSLNLLDHYSLEWEIKVLTLLLEIHRGGGTLLRTGKQSFGRFASWTLFDKNLKSTSLQMMENPFCNFLPRITFPTKLWWSTTVLIAFSVPSNRLRVFVNNLARRTSCWRERNAETGIKNLGIYLAKPHLKFFHSKLYPHHDSREHDKAKIPCLVSKKQLVFSSVCIDFQSKRAITSVHLCNTLCNTRLPAS